MMNKGLEVIEAHWLFGVPYSRIEVLVHPQSIVHSLVRLVDGSCLAQMAVPDMRQPLPTSLKLSRALAFCCAPAGSCQSLLDIQERT